MRRILEWSTITTLVVELAFGLHHYDRALNPKRCHQAIDFREDCSSVQLMRSNKQTVYSLSILRFFERSSATSALSGMGTVMV